MSYDLEQLRADEASRKTTFDILLRQLQEAERRRETWGSQEEVRDAEGEIKQLKPRVQRAEQEYNRAKTARELAEELAARGPREPTRDPERGR